MAEENNHIDRYFREKLAKAEMPVSNDDWNKLLSKLPPAEKPRKKFAWWWLALVVGILAISTFMVLNFTKEKKAQTQPTAPKTESLANAFETPTTETPVQEDINAENIGSDIKAPGTASARVKKSPDAKSKTEAEKPETNPKISEPEKENSVPSAKEGNNSSPSENPDSTETENTEISPDMPADQKPSISLKSEKTVEELPTVIISSGSWFLYGAFGPALTNMNASSSGAATQYQTLQQSNSAAVTPFLRIGLGKSFNKWSVQADIDYSSISQSASHNFNKQIFDSIPVLDPSGNIIGYFFNNYRDTSLTYNTANSSSQLGLNLMIARKFNLGQKSKLHLGVGGGYSINIQAEGDVMDPISLYKVPIETILADASNVQLNINMRYEYAILPKASLFGGLMFRQRFGDFYNNSEGYKPSFLQFELGIFRTLK